MAPFRVVNSASITSPTIYYIQYIPYIILFNFSFFIFHFVQSQVRLHETRQTFYQLRSCYSEKEMFRSG